MTNRLRNKSKQQKFLDISLITFLWLGELLYIYSIGTAVANLSPTCLTLTLTFCLTCPFLTNNTNPCTLAIPSPCLLISIISTSYSLPTSLVLEQENLCWKLYYHLHLNSYLYCDNNHYLCRNSFWMSVVLDLIWIAHVDKHEIYIFVFVFY